MFSFAYSKRTISSNAFREKYKQMYVVTKTGRRSRKQTGEHTYKHSEDIQTGEHTNKLSRDQ
jgi:hypothetical protein